MDDWRTEESVAMRLESLASEGFESIPASEMLTEFVESTSMLSPSERAQLVRTAVEATDYNRIGQGFQTAGSFIQGIGDLGASIASLFSGRDAQTAQQVLRGIGGVGGSLSNTIGGAIQTFGRPQQGQVQPLPSQSPQTPQQRPPPQGQPQRPGVPQPQQQQPQQQQPQQQQPQGFNAAALLQQLLSSGQLITGLAQGIVGGTTGPREVVLEMAGPEGVSEVAIPLGAVMNTIAHLATEAMHEFEAATHERESDVPEYIVSESGEYIVDPMSPAARAALVLDYFRRAQAARAQRSNDFFDFFS